MKKIWSNFWIIFGMMLLVSIADLIGLGTIDKLGHHWNMGMGFILTFALFVWFIARKIFGKSDK